MLTKLTFRRKSSVKFQEDFRLFISSLFYYWYEMCKPFGQRYVAQAPWPFLCTCYYFTYVVLFGTINTNLKITEALKLNFLHNRKNFHVLMLRDNWKLLFIIRTVLCASESPSQRPTDDSIGCCTHKSLNLRSSQYLRRIHVFISFKLHDFTNNSKVHSPKIC